MVAIVIISLQEVRVLIILITIHKLRTPGLAGPGFISLTMQSDLGWRYCYFLTWSLVLFGYVVGLCSGMSELFS